MCLYKRIFRVLVAFCCVTKALYSITFSKLTSDDLPWISIKAADLQLLKKWK